RRLTASAGRARRLPGRVHTSRARRQLANPIPRARHAIRRAQEHGGDLMSLLGSGAKAKVVSGLFALPTPVRRLLAGPPLRIDGQEMALDAQLAIRLKNRSGSDVFDGPVDEARARYDALPSIIGYESPVPIATREIMMPAEHGDIPATLYTP